MTISFTLPVACRTKNTGTITDFGVRCNLCRRGKFSRVVPSDQYQAFLKECLIYGPAIRDAIQASGKLKLPIACHVSVNAQVYRDADTGDWQRYVEAIADMLQQPLYKVFCPNNSCLTPKRREPTRCIVTWEQVQAQAVVECAKCGTRFPAVAVAAETERDGLGIIADDRQIRDWDGTRLHVDARDPRIFFTIKTIEGTLFE